MEWLTNILVSSNAIPVLISTVIIIIVVALIAKKGLFRLNVRGISIGNNSQSIERNIIKKQITYTKAELDIFFKDIIDAQKDVEGFDLKTTLLCREFIYDVLVEAIAVNNMADDEVYIEDILIRVIAEVVKADLKVPKDSKEFKKACTGETEKIIKRCVEIKKYYLSKKDF